MPSAFPTDSDVSTFLAQLGYSFTARTGSASIALNKFLADTGRSPWFAAEETRTFDPPQGRLLYLRGAALDVTQVTFDGEAIDADAWEFMPPAFVQFTYDIGPYAPQTVGVTATWGYAAAGADAVPYDAYNAVLYYAGYLNIQEMLSGLNAGGVTGPVKRARHAQVEYEYALGDSEAVATPGASLLAFYEDVVSTYTVLVGVS